MRIVCWQTVLMKYHTLFFAKIRKDVEKFVVCCIRDWHFKGLHATPNVVSPKPFFLKLRTQPASLEINQYLPFTAYAIFRSIMTSFPIFRQHLKIQEKLQ